MEWIKECRARARALDVSPRSLRRFGFVVGSVLAGLSGWQIARHPAMPVPYALALASVLLLVMGLMWPQRLKGVFRFWMGAAFAIGYVVSRALLSAVFFLILTPIGIVGHVFGHRFLDICDRRRRTTYWIDRRERQSINYEKLY